MCAIAGILGLPATDKTKESMLKTMQRRGPDANGTYEFPECTLLHARLAVMDPKGGSQPMILSWGEEKYVIVYNGELYNTEEIRAELSALGHMFLGHSDTEVVLHAYAQWKEECLLRFNGIFAFAVWQERGKRLFLARDRMGVKPLFYAQYRSGLLFSSEIKTILCYPGFSACLAPEGAADILLLGPGRTSGCGVFAGIDELPGGWYGVWDRGSFHRVQYWKLKDREHNQTLEETTETVRYLVLDAIQRQMVSDVPIGTFLSGGLDSSLITAVCAEEMKKQGKQLTTFSVDYVDNDKYFTPNKFQPNSDGYYIRLMRDMLDTNHFDCVLSPEDLVDHIECAVEARDLPGMADVDISLLMFCREIKNRVTVALSGECADEIFGGYPWYRDPQIRDREGFPWAQNTHQRCELMTQALKERIDGEDYIRQRYEDTCRNSDILPGTDPVERRMKQMINLNQQWFMQTLLDRKDRMSMYSGLEVRVPFCDYRIAEYLYGVPWRYKDWGGREKGLLRHAMEGILPQEVLWRKKSPYPKTFDPAYLKLVRARLERVLAEKDAPLFHLVSRENVQKLIHEEHPWPWYGQLMKQPQTICFLLQLDIWLRKYNVNMLF